MNQTVRWVTTKETHASHIINTVSEYFLTQKVCARCVPPHKALRSPSLSQVKPVAKGSRGYQEYCDVLAVHHKVMSDAMKTKQSVDGSAVKNLAHSVEHLSAVYSK